MAHQNRGCLSSVLSLLGLLFLIALIKCNSCADEEPSKQVQSSTTNETDIAPLQTSETLSKEDTLELVHQLKEIDNKLDAIDRNARKYIAQHDRLLKAYINYRASDHQVYEAAKVAKSALEKYGYQVNNIQPPEKLPKVYKDTFNRGISETSNCYLTRARAFGKSMDMIDAKGDESTFDKMNEDIENSNQSYYDGVACIFVVEYHFGLHKYSKKKTHK